MAEKKGPNVDPLLWMGFGAGGAIAAVALPIVVFLFGIAFPLGLLTAPSHAHMLAIFHHPLTRLALFPVCAFCLFHWGHRFRYTLYDGLQIKHLDELINTVCYGGAAAGTVAAGWVLWQA